MKPDGNVSFLFTMPGPCNTVVHRSTRISQKHENSQASSSSKKQTSAEEGSGSTTNNESFSTYVKNNRLAAKSNGHFISPTGKVPRRPKQPGSEKNFGTKYFTNQPTPAKEDYKSFRAYRRPRNYEIYEKSPITSKQPSKTLAQDLTKREAKSKNYPTPSPEEGSSGTGERFVKGIKKARKQKITTEDIQNHFLGIEKRFSGKDKIKTVLMVNEKGRKTHQTFDNQDADSLTLKTAPKTKKRNSSSKLTIKAACEMVNDIKTRYSGSKGVLCDQNLEQNKVGKMKVKRGRCPEINMNLSQSKCGTGKIFSPPDKSNMMRISTMPDRYRILPDVMQMETEN